MADVRVTTDCERGELDTVVALLRGGIVVCSRSESVLFDFADKFVEREMGCAFWDDALDVFSDDFWRITVTELFGVRRTAARDASILSSATAPPNVSGARHTAKSNLIPFIPYVVMLANL